jgi:uncharacterized protein YecE (DUF72 family)
MKIHIAQASLQGSIERYATRFDSVELLAESGRLPRGATLRQWRKAVSEEFEFSLVLPRSVGSLEGGASDDGGLAFALSAAETLEATWLVLRTPPSVTPSASMRRRLVDLSSRIAGAGPRVAWEPRGVWDARDADAFGADCGLHVVRDGAREDLPTTPVVYTRLRALGPGATLGAGAVELLAARLVGHDEAFIVVEGSGAGRLRQGLLDEFAELEEAD